MEKKTDLNNTQRKMLDEVYMQHFEVVVKNIKDKRNAEYDRLKQQVKKDFMKKYADKISAYEKAAEILWKLDQTQEETGLQLFRYSSDRPNKLEVSIRNSYCIPVLQKYSEETRRIEEELSKKKKEIRARIYGMDMTYEQVESEISKELASIKY